MNHIEKLEQLNDSIYTDALPYISHVVMRMSQNYSDACREKLEGILADYTEEVTQVIQGAKDEIQSSAESREARIIQNLERIQSGMIAKVVEYVNYIHDTSADRITELTYKLDVMEARLKDHETSMERTSKILAAREAEADFLSRAATRREAEANTAMATRREAEANCPPRLTAGDDWADVDSKSEGGAPDERRDTTVDVYTHYKARCVPSGMIPDRIDAGLICARDGRPLIARIRRRHEKYNVWEDGHIVELDPRRGYRVVVDATGHILIFDSKRGDSKDWMMYAKVVSRSYGVEHPVDTSEIRQSDRLDVIHVDLASLYLTRDDSIYYKDGKPYELMLDGGDGTVLYISRCLKVVEKCGGWYLPHCVRSQDEHNTYVAVRQCIDPAMLSD